MKRATITSAPLNALIAMAVVMIATAMPAAAADYVQTTGDIALYVGVVPAAMARRHAPEQPETMIHGGAPTWGEQYHLMVALFERASGKRINDAKIKATLFNASKPGNRLPGSHKELKPMPAGSEAAYGNYFNMPASFPHRIELEVLRPGRAEITKASFEYRHALVTTQQRPDRSH
jgi:hypothetical protein